MISLDRIPAALACVATCALLSACAVGPDYQRPLVATPEQFRQEPPPGWKEADAADRLPRGRWWTLFGDVEADADQAFARVRSAMRALTGAVLDRAEADGVLPRTAAHALVAERLPVIAERYGWY